MTKQELWAIYVERNPTFKGEGNVTISKRGLRKLFDTTWDIAYYAGEPENRPEDYEDTIAMEHLKSIFGMR